MINYLIFSYNNNSNKQVNKYELFPFKIYNKLEDNYHMTNKKALFLNMKNYYEALGEDPFNSLPITFHIKDGLDDPEFTRFKQFYENLIDQIKKIK